MLDQWIGGCLAFLDSEDLGFPWTLASFAGLIRELGGPALMTASLCSFQQTAELAEVQAGPPETRIPSRLPRLQL